MSDPSDVFDLVGLTEYETTALEELLSLGRTTAPNLADATDIPKARIYGVLDSLADRGFVKVVPGRPKEYQPKAPEELLDRAIENRRQSYEHFAAEIDDSRDAFLSTYRPSTSARAKISRRPRSCFTSSTSASRANVRLGGCTTPPTRRSESSPTVTPTSTASRERLRTPSTGASTSRSCSSIPTGSRRRKPPSRRISSTA